MDRQKATDLALSLCAVFSMAMSNRHREAASVLHQIKDNIESDADIEAIANEAWVHNLTMFNTVEKIKHHLAIK